MNRHILAWGLYGSAYSLFIGNVASLYFPLWMKQQTGSDQLVGQAIAAALVALAVLLPFKGAMQSRIGRHPIWLWGATLVYTILTVALGWVQTPLMAAVIFFFAYSLASLGYFEQTRLIPALAHEASVTKVSGVGNALFSLGSLLGVPIIGVLVGLMGQHAAFPLLGVVGLLLSIPLLLNRKAIAAHEQPAPRKLQLKGFSMPAYFTRFFTGVFAYFMAFGAIIAFFAIWATGQAGVERQGITALLTLFFFFSLVGGLAYSKLGLRGLTELHWLAGLWALLCAAAPLYPTVAMCAAVMILGGLLNGAMFSGYRAFIGHFAPKGQSDLYYALATSCFYMSQGIGVFLFGRLAEGSGYTVAWWCLAGIFAIAFFAFPRHAQQASAPARA